MSRAPFPASGVRSPVPATAFSAAANAANAVPVVPVVQRVRHSNYVPAQVDRHLQSLDFNHEGHLLLGSSSLTTRHWTGSLWFYLSPSDAPSAENCLTGVDLDNGLFEAIFIGDTGKQVLVALDNGSIEHFNLSLSEEDVGPSFHFLEKTMSIQEHNDIITGMVRTCDGRGLVTSSYDRSMVVLDLPTLAKRKELINAHDDLVLSVDASKVNPEIFVSASQDGKVALWDMREQAGINVLYDNANAVPTAVQCLPGSDNLVLIGNTSGEVGLYDLRQPEHCLFANRSYNQQIFKIRFCNKRSNTFAVCGDSPRLCIFGIDSASGFTSRYENDSRHQDFVRGLAWHPNEKTVWTCSWDKTVASHEIP